MKDGAAFGHVAAVPRGAPLEFGGVPKGRQMAPGAFPIDPIERCGGGGGGIVRVLLGVMVIVRKYVLAQIFGYGFEGELVEAVEARRETAARAPASLPPAVLLLRSSMSSRKRRSGRGLVWLEVRILNHHDGGGLVGWVGAFAWLCELNSDMSRDLL